MATECVHECAKACRSMEDSLRIERESTMRYRRLISECDFPEVRIFLEHVLAAREELCSSFESKLAELQALREISEQISTIF